MNTTTSRRSFIKMSGRLGLAAPFLYSALSGCQENASNQQATSESKKLNILILGGTGFLGPHQIVYALERGHSVSTFTRGKTAPTVHQEYFSKVEQLTGDRNDDLKALENRKWDAVIDNSGQRVAWTEKSAQMLKDSCDLYLYTSSTGVYYPYLESGYQEDATLVMTEPEGITDEEIKLEYWYGVMKANSELAASQAFGIDRTIIVRPTYMIGPSDRSNRFIHWPVRLSRGGATLVPGKPTDMVQYIDVRDVAEWMIRLIESRQAGVYNAVGPKSSQNVFDFVEEAKTAFEVDSQLVKVDDYEFLKANNINNIIPWILPEGNNYGSALISNAKAMANGLTLRPLANSVKDIHDWWYSDTLTQEQRDKFEKDPEGVLMREPELLAKWAAR